MDNHTAPRVAVLIAAYNAEKTIVNTIASLNLDQDPHDIIIVDDASSIPISRIVPAQNNIHIIRSETNVGAGEARNIGFSYILSAGYEYIAIVDADDTVSPERLRSHREFLDDNPDYGIVGCWIRAQREDGSSLYYLMLPTSNEDIVKGLYYNTCIQFGMYRADAIRRVGFYKGILSEDYDLARRIARHYKVANLPYYYYNYTIYGASVSQRQFLRVMISLLCLQWLHRDLFRVHFYLGILRTVLRVLLHPIRKNARPSARGDAVPVFRLDPLRGQVLEGEVQEV